MANGQQLYSLEHLEGSSWRGRLTQMGISLEIKQTTSMAQHRYMLNICNGKIQGDILEQNKSVKGSLPEISRRELSKQESQVFQHTEQSWETAVARETCDNFSVQKWKTFIKWSIFSPPFGSSLQSSCAFTNGMIRRGAYQQTVHLWEGCAAASTLCASDASWKDPQGGCDYWRSSCQHQF